MPPKPLIFRSIALALRDVASAARAMQAEFAIVFAALLASELVSKAMLPQDPAKFELTAATTAYFIVNALVFGAVFPPLAVLIHRRIILGEEGGFTNLPTLRSRIAEFFVVSVVLNLSMGLVLFLPLMAAKGSPSVALALASVVGLFAFIYLSCRLFLIFPAIAIDDRDKRVATAFRRSRGLVWQSFAALFLLTIALMLVEKGVSFAAVRPRSRSPRASTCGGATLTPQSRLPRPSRTA